MFWWESNKSDKTPKFECWNLAISQNYVLKKASVRGLWPQKAKGGLLETASQEFHLVTLLVQSLKPRANVWRGFVWQSPWSYCASLESVGGETGCEFGYCFWVLFVWSAWNNRRSFCKHFPNWKLWAFFGKDLIEFFWLSFIAVIVWSLWMDLIFFPFFHMFLLRGKKRGGTVLVDEAHYWGLAASLVIKCEVLPWPAIQYKMRVVIN